jgi:hypothetical protein
MAASSTIRLGSAAVVMAPKVESTTGAGIDDIPGPAAILGISLVSTGSEHERIRT